MPYLCFCDDCPDRKACGNAMTCHRVHPGGLVSVRQWRVVKLDGVPYVRATCPGCDLEALLDHDIADDGTVSPSMDCPNDRCDFHANVRLELWQPLALSR